MTRVFPFANPDHHAICIEQIEYGSPSIEVRLGLSIPDALKLANDIRKAVKETVRKHKTKKS